MYVEWACTSVVWYFKYCYSIGELFFVLCSSQVQLDALAERIPEVSEIIVQEVPLPEPLPEELPLAERPPEEMPLAERLPEELPLAERPPEEMPLAERLPEELPLAERLPEELPLAERLPEELPLPERPPEVLPVPERPPEEPPTIQPQEPETQGVPQEEEMASPEKLIFLCLSTLMFNARYNGYNKMQVTVYDGMLFWGYSHLRSLIQNVNCCILTCICLTAGMNLLTPSTVRFVTSSQRGLTCVGAECGKERGGGDGPYIRRGAD